MGVVDLTKLKTKLAWFLEASESTRLRMGESFLTHHEDHIAGKEDNSLFHYLQFGSQIYSYAPSLENSLAKAAVGLEKFRRG